MTAARVTAARVTAARVTAARVTAARAATGWARRIAGSGTPLVLQLLRLVPATGTGLVSAVCAAGAVAGLAPTAAIVVSGWLVQSLALAGAEGLDSAAGRRAVWLLVLFAALFAVGQAASALSRTLAAIAGSRLDGQLQRRAIRAVNGPATVAHLDDAGVQDHLSLLGRDGVHHVVSIGAAVIFLRSVTQVGQSSRGTQDMQVAYGLSVLPAVTAVERVATQVSARPDSPDQPGPPRGGTRITLTDVTFRYPGTQKTALNGFSLVVPAARSLAVVGVNGAGKTTLIKLLCRLARALIREESLLMVFDEPTAALDALAEEQLFGRISETVRDRAAAGAVTLLVSHRFTTVTMADLIVVLSGGQIVELGDHQTLRRGGGLYQELYEIAKPPVPITIGRDRWSREAAHGTVMDHLEEET